MERSLRGNPYEQVRVRAGTSIPYVHISGILCPLAWAPMDPPDPPAPDDPACPLQRILVMDAVAKSCTSSRTALRNGSASSPDQIMHDGEGDKQFSADSRSSNIPPDSYKHEIHSSAGFEPLRPQGVAF